jgi:hypothetical protein
MKRWNWLRFCLLIVMGASLYGLALRPASGADVPNKKVVLAQARKAYYSLRNVGLLEFQSTVSPTWEVALRDVIKTNPAGAQTALKTLSNLHFAMTLDPAGAVAVTHQSDIAPANEQIKQGFDQIFSGMEQAVSGFFETWSPFVLTSPFPEVESEYQLEDLGREYRLSYKEGTADVVTTMTKDLVITDLKVTTSAFDSVLKPQFAKGPGGFVLAGYEANYIPTSGPGKTHLIVQIEYRETSGLQLPYKLNLDSVYDGTPTQMELTFTDYQVKKR